MSHWIDHATWNEEEFQEKRLLEGDVYVRAIPKPEQKTELEVTLEMTVRRTFTVRVTPDELESVRDDAWIPNLANFQEQMVHDTDYNRDCAEWDWKVELQHDDGYYECIIDWD